MKFKFETEYNLEAGTIASKIARKTFQKKRSIAYRISMLICFILIALCIYNEGIKLNFLTIASCIVLPLGFLTIVFDDKIRGYQFVKLTLKGMKNVKTIFNDDGYYSETEVTNYNFKYNVIQYMMETNDYFVLFFSKRHCHIFSKKNISGGTIEEFREFITGVTGKTIQTFNF